MKKLYDKHCSYSKLVNWLEKEHNVLFSTFNIRSGLITTEELEKTSTVIFKNSFEDINGLEPINEVCYLLKNNLYIYYYDHSTYILCKSEQKEEMVFFHNQLKKKSKNGING